MISPHPTPSSYPLSLLAAAGGVLFWEAMHPALANTPILASTTARGGSAPFLASETLAGILGSLLLFLTRGTNVSPSPLSLPLYLESDRMSVAARTIVQHDTRSVGEKPRDSEKLALNWCQQPPTTRLVIGVRGQPLLVSAISVTKNSITCVFLLKKTLLHSKQTEDEKIPDLAERRFNP